MTGKLPRPYAEHADAYVAAGWAHPIPLGSPGRRRKKFPPPDDSTGWSHEPPTPADVEGWIESHGANNIGLRLPDGVVGIDVDDYDDKHGAEQLEALEAELGKLPAAPRSTSRGADNPSGIRFFRVPAGTHLKGNAAKDIEIIQHGHRYAVVWPSVHPEGGTYEWLTRTGAPTSIPKVVNLNPLPGAWLARFARAAESTAPGKAGIDFEDLSTEAAREWLNAHGSGEPCRAVKGVMKAALRALEDQSESREASHYDTARDAVYALAKLAAEEHRGARPAIKVIGEAYLAYTATKAERDPTEWARMVTGGISKVAGTTDDMWTQHLEDDCPDRPGVDSSKQWPSPNAPLAVAHRWLDDHHTIGEGAEAETTLRHWRGDFYAWTGSHWSVVATEDIEARLYRALADAEYWSAAATPIVLQWHPDKSKIGKVTHALANSPRVHRPSSIEPDGNAVDFLNGVLDLDSRALKPATPERFNLSALPFNFDPDAGVPRRWLAFLAMVLDDDESIDLLQEWFGYIISADTRVQRFLFMLGPSRSGKGTIVRTLEALLGAENIAAPTSTEIATRFGLSPTIGKSLAVVQDASFAGRDGKAVVEKLKTLTGKDTAQIDRKNRDAWVGRPTARWMIVSNELLSLIDSSGALMRRMLGPIETVRELEDDEIDEDLDDKIEAEIGAVLMWALDGLDRLRESAWKFTVPGVARNVRREMSEMMSPIRAFVGEVVDEIGGDAFTPSERVYGAYREWCERTGHAAMMSTVFGKDMKSGAGLDKVRRRIEGEPTWGYAVTLKTRTASVPGLT